MQRCCLLLWGLVFTLSISGFGAGGFTRVHLPDRNLSPSSIHLFSDGSALVLGTDWRGMETRGFALRLSAVGEIDKRFGDKGFIFRKGLFSGAHLFQNGGFLLCGSQNMGKGDSTALWVGKFNANGNPDLTFGEKGSAIADFGPEEDYPSGMLVDNRGRITVAGVVGRGPFNPEMTTHFIAARVLPSGKLDSSFGQGGMMMTKVPGGPYSCQQLFPRKDDGYVLTCAKQQWIYGGLAADDTGVILSVNPNGSVDLVTNLRESGYPGTLQAGMLLPDGTLLVGVDTPRGKPDGSRFLRAAVTPGKTVITQVFIGSQVVRGLAMAESGVFVYSSGATDASLALQKVLMNGSGILKSFGKGGTLKETLSRGQTNALNSQIAVHPDSQAIYFLGNTSYNGASDMPESKDDLIIARFKSTGELDSNFGE